MFGTGQDWTYRRPTGPTRVRTNITLTSQNMTCMAVHIGQLSQNAKLQIKYYIT